MVRKALTHGYVPKIPLVATSELACLGIATALSKSHRLVRGWVWRPVTALIARPRCLRLKSRYLAELLPVRVSQEAFLFKPDTISTNTSSITC